MANTKISQLPLFTGNTLGGYLVWNNSAETTTSKIVYSVPIKQVGTSIFPTNTNLTNTDCILIGNVSVDNSSRVDCIGIGRGITHGGARSIGIGQDQTGVVDDSVIIGFQAGGTGNGGTICVGRGAKSRGNYGISIGLNGIMSGDCDRTHSIGAESNIGGNYALNFGAGNTVSAERAILIGVQQSISSPFSTLVNGITNTLNSTGRFNNIFNGSGNTIGSSFSGVTMLSCFGRTASASNTTLVENLQVLRTPSTQVQPISSGATFTCNLDLGAKSQFFVTGTSTINITNVRDGASFMIKTQTDGNYVMTWTATGGYTFLFEGGLKDPGNSVIDIFKFEVFGNVIYGSRAHNFS